MGTPHSNAPTWANARRSLCNCGNAPTTRDPGKTAADAGVPAVELPKLAARGGLENVAYGIYRVPDAPASAFDQFAEALLRAGEGPTSMETRCSPCWGSPM